MISRLTKLTTVTATFNIVLSAYIIASIVTYKPVINENEWTLPPTITDNISDSDNSNENTEGVIENTPTLIRNDNTVLSSSEISALLKSRNPFEIPPEIDSRNKKEQEQKLKEIEELRLKLENEKKEQEKLEQQEQNTTNIEGSTDNTSDKQDSSAKIFLTRDEAKTIATNSSKKYNVPISWVVSVMQGTSNFQTNLTTTDGDINRRGIMQYREKDAKAISESLGLVYQSNKDLNAAVNIALGTSYLSSLYNKNKDLNFVFSSYYMGIEEAEKLNSTQGNYKTEFSQKMIKLINEYK